MSSSINLNQDKKLSPSSSGPARRPTSAEVLTTYQKLFNQTQTPRVSTWSGKTLEKALGWASLADRTKKWSDDQKPRLTLLTSLVENPFTSDALREQCERGLDEGVLKQTLERRKIALHSCERELPKWVRQSGISEDELIKRVAAREVARRCRRDPASRSSLIHNATDGHAFSLEVIVRIAANNESEDDWIYGNVGSIASGIRRSVDPELLRRTCQTNVRFGGVMKSNEQGSNIQ